MQAKLVALNARFTHSCLALFCIRNELRLHAPAIDVELCQYTINDPYYDMVLRIAEGDPKYVFFSALIWNSDLLEKLLEDLSLVLNDTKFIVGGPQAEIVVGNVKVACTLVRGEIEAVSSSFFKDLELGELQKQYSGSFLAEKQTNLEFPYDEEDFELHLKNRHIYYESSRGCPFSCTYCLSSKEKGVFHKPADQVIKEIDRILSHNPKVVRFVDRTFNAIPERSLTIWKYLASKDCDTLFHFEIAPDRFTDEMLEFLATVPAHRFQFEIGIQSTHPETLEAINRKVDTKVSHNVIKRLTKPNNIHVHVDLILGLPFEDEFSFAKSFKDVFAMEPHYIQMGLLKILPDTEICYGADDYGYLASKKAPYSIFSSKWMDTHKLQELYWFCECVESFLNNRYFVSLWEHLRKVDEDIHQFFSGILAICKERNFFQYAATHELMGEIVLAHCKRRADYLLICELLKFDWLRCGHRFFPKFLSENISEDKGSYLLNLKKKLFGQMPEEKVGIWTKENKSKFFKKALFLQFTAEALESLGFLPGESLEGVVCFKHERERKVHSFCETIFIE